MATLLLAPGPPRRISDGGDGSGIYLIGGEAQGLSVDTDHGGNVSISGGASQSGLGGSISVLSGKSAGGSSGHVSVGTVDAGVSGVSGDLNLTTGSSTSGSSGLSARPEDDTTAQE